MTTPKRLLETASPHVRSLLLAGKRDAPASPLAPALLGALGLAATTTFAPSLLARAWLALKHLATTKASVTAIVLGAATAGYVTGRLQERSARTTQTQTQTPTQMQMQMQTPTPTPTRTPTPTPTQTPITSTPDTNAPTLMLTPTRTPTLTLTPTPTAQPQVHTDPDSPPPRASLSDEIDSLKRARTDVLAKNGTSALATLDAYAAAHPRGVLEEEALALRVRALRLTGDTAGAATVLADLRARFPASVHLAALATP